MTGADMCAWRTRLALRQEDAASLIGCSSRRLRSYEHDDAIIPRKIELACEAIEARLTRGNENAA
jgi:DNA-binding XRE family transcriptional regulator